MEKTGEESLAKRQVSFLGNSGDTQGINLIQLENQSKREQMGQGLCLQGDISAPQVETVAQGEQNLWADLSH